MKIGIEHKINGEVLFACEAESMKLAVSMATNSGKPVKLYAVEEK